MAQQPVSHRYSGRRTPPKPAEPTPSKRQLHFQTGRQNMSGNTVASSPVKTPCVSFPALQDALLCS